MPINLVITNAGRAALVNAANTGTLPVTITQIGVAAVYTAPVQTLTALPSEIKRLSAIAGQVVADDILHVSMKDESTDAYALRSIALYLGNGTLFACAGQSDPMLNKASSAVALAAFDIAFDDIDAASISFGDTDFMMPSATTEVQGVVELATVAEAQAGIDALRALTPSSARAAVLGWLLAQDGSGSGLDADLLDGQHGAWYADIAARLGFNPANKAGDTFTGRVHRDPGYYLDLQASDPVMNFDAFDYLIYERAANVLRMIIGGTEPLTLSSTAIRAFGNLIWHAGNDGSGSGLDADLLDGQHGAWYADIAARLGFNPANKAGDTFTGRVHRDPGYYLDLQASNPVMNFDAFDYLIYERAANVLRMSIGGTEPLTLSSTAIRAFGNLIWHAGNDGSGSGLDADMLDGFQAEDFARVVLFDPSPNGGIRFLIGGVGLGISWGRWTSSAIPGDGVWVGFTQAFSAEPFTLQLTPVVDGTGVTSAWAGNWINGGGFYGRCNVASIGCRYLAIGKWT